MFKNSITGLSEILDQSIDIFEKALLVDNQNSIGRVTIEKTLDKAIERRYEMSKSLGDLVRAISLLDLASKNVAASNPETLTTLRTHLFLMRKPRHVRISTSVTPVKNHITDVERCHIRHGARK